MIVTATLLALLALGVGIGTRLVVSDRKAEAAHTARVAELRAEQDRAWAGVLNRNANWRG